MQRNFWVMTKIFFNWETRFFGFYSADMGVFWRKNLKTVSIPRFPQTRLYSFLLSNVPFPQKWSWALKIFFQVILENIVFFFEKIIIWKISKISFPTKRSYWFLLSDAPFPAKQPCPRANRSSQFFPKILLFSKNFFNNKISCT